MPDVVYLNGEFLPANEAKISVLDRGFVFGDGVYEVIPVYGGHLFRLEHHLSRLDDSLVSVRIAPPLSHDQWHTLLKRLVKENGDGDQSIYLQITRGVAPRDHAFPEKTEPTVMAMSSRLKSVSGELLTSGVCAVTMEDTRWKHCNVKSIALLPNILARQQALDMGAAEAILIRDGYVTEGAASNVFVIKGRHLTTPPKSQHLLPGITRDLILELAKSNGIACQEAQIPEHELLQADEIWLTSSTKEVLAVTRLNGHPVGPGMPGPLWSRMLTIFQEYKQKVRQNGTDELHQAAG